MCSVLPGLGRPGLRHDHHLDRGHPHGVLDVHRHRCRDQRRRRADRHQPDRPVFGGLFDIPAEFQQLTLPVFDFLAVVGAVVGAVVWHLVVTRSRNASGVLRVLVPTVVVLSLVPDVMLLVSDSQPGTTTAGVVALMLMHVAVAAVAVPVYRRFIPPRS